MRIDRILTVVLGCCTAAAVLPVHAHEAGNWLVRGGLHNISPKSDNGDIVEVDDDLKQYAFIGVIADEWEKFEPTFLNIIESVELKQDDS